MAKRKFTKEAILRNPSLLFRDGEPSDVVEKVQEEFNKESELFNESLWRINRDWSLLSHRVVGE